MHNIKTNFDKILGVIKDILGDEINEKGNYLRRGTKPKFSGIEVIALSLIWFKPLQPTGCGYHPSAADHEVMASQLVPFIKTLQ